VQPGGCNHFRIIGYGLYQFRHRMQVYMVWLVIVFPALIDALVCLGCISPGTLDQIGHYALPVTGIVNPLPEALQLQGRCIS
jgi:hypothetical protein